MNIVIPMAGEGQRFKEAGINTPKPLIRVKGKTLLQWSVDSLPLEMAGKIIFVMLKKHEEEHRISHFIKQAYGNYDTEFVFLEDVTGGQAETVLKAKPYIREDSSLLIFNIDTYFYSGSLGEKLKASRHDGVLGAFHSKSSKYSFAKLNDEGYVEKVAEKQPISEYALTGLYHFSNAKDFIWAAERAIKNQDSVKGEYYVAPLYNYLIEKGRKFILDMCQKHYILGTPEELDTFKSIE